MIEIKHNFLNDTEYHKLFKVINDMNFPWHWTEGATYQIEDSTPSSIKLNSIEGFTDYPQLIHSVYGNKKPNSAYYNIIDELLLCKILIEGDAILRIKLNCNFPVSKSIIGKPHIDSTDALANKTSIYYLNDSDGDTIFFNESLDDDFTELTIKQKFTPKANTLITFDTNTIHCGCPPVNTLKRLIMNIVHGRT
jgi:hypothetical protein